MLSGTACTDVFAITGEATLFPGCSVENKLRLVELGPCVEVAMDIDTHLFTKSCSFCIGSGSPSLPHASTSFASYTRIIRSEVLIKNELQMGRHITRANSNRIDCNFYLLAASCKLNTFDSGGT